MPRLKLPKQLEDEIKEQQEQEQQEEEEEKKTPAKRVTRSSAKSAPVATGPKQTSISSFFSKAPDTTNKEDEKEKDKPLKQSPQKKTTTTTTTTTATTTPVSKGKSKVIETKAKTPIKTRGGQKKNIEEEEEDEKPKLQEQSPKTRARANVKLAFLESDDDESEDEKVKKKPINRKRKKDDSDYESEEEEEEDDDDDDYVSGEDDDTVSEQDDKDDGDDLDIMDIDKLDQMGESKDDNDNDDDDRPQIVLYDGKVVLPKGTPDFKPDPKAGLKLLKAHDTLLKMREEQTNKTPKADGEEDEEEEEEKPKKKTAAGGKGKAKGPNYTPLELQFIEIKKKHPDTVLMVECGYKYRFFGEDAEVANKVLNIYSYVAKNFLNASIPCQRLYFHLRRLVHAGYKVGVVEQTETAALKAISTSKSQPFERKLTRVYTSSTFIDDTVDDTLSASDSSPNYMVSLYETYKQEDETEISFIAVSIRTGEIIYDTFKDNLMRGQLETILTHLKPSEILIPPSLEKVMKQQPQQQDSSDFRFSSLTTKVLKNYCKTHHVRTQVMSADLFNHDKALLGLMEFYESCGMESALTSIKSILKQNQIVCLGVLLVYLKQFVQFCNILQMVDRFKPFRLNNHLVLPHSTIENLEILNNESDHTERGSLFWILNHTQTFSGRRLLSNWLCKPLNNLESIIERQDAVTELVDSLKGARKISQVAVEKITQLLKSHIPDLQKNISRIYYKSQCTPKDFVNTMESFKKIVSVFSFISSGDNTDIFNSKLLKSIFNMEKDQQIESRVGYFLENINIEKAKENFIVGADKSNLWINLDKYPKIKEAQDEINNINSQLSNYLKSIRVELGKPTLEYTHMPKLNAEYLIELPISFKNIPKNWFKVNSTQKLVRYHTPTIVDQIKLLSQNREKLKLSAQEAWISFLNEFNNDYILFSNFITKLSNLDCLMSLAKVSSFDGYVKPIFNDKPGIEIVDGRHPVVEVLRDYVPNSICLKSDKETSMIITGPNMGGKSSFIRMTSLLVVMSQIGCYVPAVSCNLGVFDAIYTRMGARDHIEKGHSTFFVEIQETSDILSMATPNSLVILDELGRGTSTHDGVAIAYATLKYIVEKINCFCLFVTHYPLLAQLENQYPKQIGNYHMGFIEEKEDNQNNNMDDQDNSTTTTIPKVIFLYKVEKGAAQNSYGLNVANLAGLPKEILIEASKKSNEIKESITSKAKLEVTNSLDINDKTKQLIQSVKSVMKSKVDIITKLKELQLNIK